MVNQLYEETISEIIMERTSCGHGWKPMHKSLRDASTETFPQAQPMAGSVLFMGWDHKHRDEMVILGAVAGEDEPWGVDVQTNGGTYHLHGARTLESACETASVCMYMLNHFANEHRNADSKQTEDKEVSDKLKNARTRIKELEEACDAHEARADKLKKKNEALRGQIDTLIETGFTTFQDGGWRGMMKQPQKWRPPKKDELIQLRNHISEHWFSEGDDEEESPLTRATSEVANAYIIVLEDRRSVVTGVEDKVMFALFKTDTLYCAYLFDDEDESLKEIKQNPDVVSDDPQREVVVNYNTDS